MEMEIRSPASEGNALKTPPQIAFRFCRIRVCCGRRQKTM